MNDVHEKWPAMVLAAGYGTRLAPLSGELPKPLVPVGDRPAVVHVLERLRAAGAEPIVMNTHHLPAAFAALAGVRLVHEPSILGTAGGLAHAAAWLGEGDVIVWNGDLMAAIDLGALRAAHRDALATLAIADLGAPGSGTVGIDAAGRVVRLRGRSFGVEEAGAEFVGAQWLSAHARARLPERGCLVGDVYLPALAAGEVVATATVVRAWRDIGSLAGYLAANLDWLAGRPSFVATGAHVAAGVELAQAIVGAGARIEGEGRLERVVVWPGARATAPLCDAVVTTSGRVVAVAG